MPQSSTSMPRPRAFSMIDDKFCSMVASATRSMPSFTPSSRTMTPTSLPSRASTRLSPPAVVSPLMPAFVTTQLRPRSLMRVWRTAGKLSARVGVTERLSPSTTMRRAEGSEGEGEVACAPQAPERAAATRAVSAALFIASSAGEAVNLKCPIWESVIWTAIWEAGNLKSIGESGIYRQSEIAKLSRI